MRFFIACLLFLNSCGYSDDFTFTWPAKIKIVSTTPAAETMQMILAIQDLNKFLPETVVSFQGDTRSIFPFQIVVRLASEDRGSYAGLATVYNDSCIITIYPVSVRNNIVKTVMWHEIAHCVGVGHKDTSGHIMSTNVHNFEGYSEEKLKVFANDFMALFNKVKF
jgi:predicted Zn-dependent protease